MTLLFLHFRWAFPTLQEFIGAEVHSTDGRAGGEREAALTKPWSEVDGYKADDFRHGEHTRSLKAPHLPAFSLSPGPATCS